MNTLGITLCLTQAREDPPLGPQTIVSTVPLRKVTNTVVMETLEPIELLLKIKEHVIENRLKSLMVEVKDMKYDITEFNEKKDKDQQEVQHDPVNIRQDKERILNEMKIFSEKWEVTKQELTTEIADLINQLTTGKCDFLRSKAKLGKPIEVGLLSKHSGMGKTMIEGITRGLQKLLEERLVRDKIDIYIKPCKSPEDVTAGPLFVLCLAKSILGTKVKALEGIEGIKDTVLILIHFDDSEDQWSPITKSVDFSYFGSDFRKLGGTVDMIYYSAGGLYDCEVNNSAVEKMSTFLKKY